jgi:hypothetical protein
MVARHRAMACLAMVLGFLAATVAGLASEPAPGAAGKAAAGPESPTVLLEKGIYLEETAGDIEGAMKLYQQVADQAKARGTPAPSFHDRGMP